MSMPCNQGKIWTAEEEGRVTKMLEDGFSTATIASMLKRTEFAIECRIKLLAEGVIMNKGINTPAQPDETIFVETKTITFLKGRDSREYSDQELMQMLHNLVDRRDNLVSSNMPATKMQGARTDQIKRNIDDLVKLMDEIFDERNSK